MSIFEEQEKDKFFNNLVQKLKNYGYRVTTEIKKKPCKCGSTMYLIDFVYICKECGKKDIIN